MNVNPTPQQKKSLEKMMKERYKVKDKFYDLKKYVPELLDGVIDEWEKKQSILKTHRDPNLLISFEF